jgi:hypothetical protein
MEKYFLLLFWNNEIDLMKTWQKEENNLHKMNSFVYNYSIEMKNGVTWPID